MVLLQSNVDLSLYFFDQYTWIQKRSLSFFFSPAHLAQTILQHGQKPKEGRRKRTFVEILNQKDYLELHSRKLSKTWIIEFVLTQCYIVLVSDYAITYDNTTSKLDKKFVQSKASKYLYGFLSNSEKARPKYVIWLSCFAPKNGHRDGHVYPVNGNFIASSYTLAMCRPGYICYSLTLTNMWEKFPWNCWI